MRKHLKAARIHRGLSWLYAASSLLFAIMLVTDAADNQSIFLLATSFFAVLFVVHYALCGGARKARSWARYGSIAIAVLMLPGVPIGTLIGIYLLTNARQIWDESANPTG